MRNDEWLQEHKKLLISLGKRNTERKLINVEIKDIKKQLGILDELLLN